MIQKNYDDLDIVIKQLQKIKEDLEFSKLSSPMSVTTAVPEGLTLDDLYKAIRNYSKSSAYNLREALKSNNITTIEELIKYRPREILRFKNVGTTTIYNTREAMEDIGILW
jgi:DNA-directed RNA polymerase alpha subunit